MVFLGTVVWGEVVVVAVVWLQVVSSLLYERGRTREGDEEKGWGYHPDS